jgi:hypothetical protein
MVWLLRVPEIGSDISSRQGLVHFSTVTSNSARLLRARPSTVLLSAIGLSSLYPTTRIREEAIPFSIKY